jgi:hypothetical protein
MEQTPTVSNKLELSDCVKELINAIKDFNMPLDLSSKDKATETKPSFFNSEYENEVVINTE